MALWGNKDGAPFGSLTATVAANPGLSLLTFSGSVSSYGIEPGNTIIVDTAGTPQFVRVKQVVSDTVVETTTDMTAVAAVDCELQQSPKYTAITDVTAGNIVGADLSEVLAGGTTDPGWLRKFTKTRDGVTVTLFETLVASSSINEDVVNEEFPSIVVEDSITITQQPDATFTKTSGGPAFDIVVAYTTTGNGAEDFYWEANHPDVNLTNGAWVRLDSSNVANYFDVASIQTTTLTMTSYNSFVSGLRLRAIITKGAVTETSTESLITVN
jgi:hypothetical protein